MGKLHLPGQLTEYIGRPLEIVQVPPSFTVGFGNVTIGNPIAKMGFSINNTLVEYVEELEYLESPNIKYNRVFHFWILDRASPDRKFGPYYVPYINDVEVITDIEGNETTKLTLRPLREVINPRFVKISEGLYEMIFFSNFTTNLLPDDKYTDDANYLMNLPEFATNYPQNILKGRSPNETIAVPKDNTTYYLPDGNPHFIGNPRMAVLSCLVRINVVEINDVYEDSPKGERVERLYAICERPRIIDWLDYRFARDSYPGLMSNRAQSIEWLPKTSLTDNAVFEAPSKQVPENHLITGIKSNMYPGHIGYDFNTMPINHFYNNSLVYVLQVKRVGEVDPHAAEYCFEYDNFRPDSPDIKIHKIEWRTLTQSSILIKRRLFGSAVGSDYAYSYIEEEYNYPYSNPSTNTHFVVLYIEYETVMEATLQYTNCLSSSSASVCDFPSFECCYEEYQLTFDYEYLVFDCGTPLSLSGSASITVSRTSNGYNGSYYRNNVTFDDGNIRIYAGWFTLFSTNKDSMSLNVQIVTNSRSFGLTSSATVPDLCCLAENWDPYFTERTYGSCQESLDLSDIRISTPTNKIEQCCHEAIVSFDYVTGSWGTVAWSGEEECECLCESDWTLLSQSATECTFHKYVKHGYDTYAICTDVADCDSKPNPTLPTVPSDDYLIFCTDLPCRCQDVEYTFREFWQESVVGLDSSYELASTYEDECDFCDSHSIDPCEICVVIGPNGEIFWGEPTAPNVCADPYIAAGAGSNYIEDYYGCQHTFGALDEMTPGDVYSVEVNDSPQVDSCFLYDINVTESIDYKTYSCGSSSASSRYPLDGLMTPIMGRPFESVDTSDSYKLGFFNKTLYSPLEPVGFDSDNSLVEYVEDIGDLNLQYDRVFHFWLIHGGDGEKIKGPFYVPYISDTNIVDGKTQYTFKPLREVINPNIKKVGEDVYIMYFFSNFVDPYSSSSSSSGFEQEYTDDPSRLKRMIEFAVDDPKFINPNAKVPSEFSNSSDYRDTPLDNVRNYHVDGFKELYNPRCALCSCIIRISDFEVPDLTSSSFSSNKIRIKYPICEKPKVIEWFNGSFSTDFIQPALTNRTQSVKWASDIFDSMYVNPEARNENPPKQMYADDIITSIEGKMYPGYVGLEFGVKEISEIYEDSLYHVFVVEDDSGNDKYYREVDLNTVLAGPMIITGFEWEHSAEPCAMNCPGLDVEDDSSENTPNAKTKTHYIVVRLQLTSSLSSNYCECNSSSWSSLSLTSNCCSGSNTCVTHDWNNVAPPVSLGYSDCAVVDFFITNMIGKDGNIVNIVGTVLFDQEFYSASVPGVKFGFPSYLNVTAYGNDGELYCLELQGYERMSDMTSGCGIDEDWRLLIKARITQGTGTSLDTPCDCSPNGTTFGVYETNKLNAPGEAKIDGYATDYVESLLTVGGTGTMVVVWKVHGLADNCISCQEL